MKEEGGRGGGAEGTHPEKYWVFNIRRRRATPSAGAKRDHKGKAHGSADSLPVSRTVPGTVSRNYPGAQGGTLSDFARRERVSRPHKKTRTRPGFSGGFFLRPQAAAATATASESGRQGRR